MATIIKRRGKDGSLSYQVRIRIKGQPASSATFHRLTDARKYAVQAEAQIAEGRYFPQGEGRRHTVSQAIDRYIENILPTKRAHTAVQQRQQLEWWRQRIGELRLSHLTAGIVIEHREHLTRATSPSTANRYMTVLSHLLKVAARDWSWLTESPLRHLSRLREPSGRTRFLDKSECERLLAVCRTSGHEHLYAIVLLALCTGCRKKEITRLCWHQIAQGCTAITLVETKNGEARRVPIVEPARHVLKVYSRIRRTLGCDWVFPRRNREGPCNINRAWDQAVKAAELKDFRFHDLRHTTASYLAMSGASMVAIAEILGHKQLTMVRRYAHLSESSLEGTLSQAMERFLG